MDITLRFSTMLFYNYAKNCRIMFQLFHKFGEKLLTIKKK